MTDAHNSRAMLAFLMGLAAASANVLGGYFVVRGDWSRRYLQYFLALGAGFMLATSLLEMLPEALRLAGEKALYLALIGFFIVHFFEHTLAPHFHFGEETHTVEMLPQRASTAALLGLLIHTFFDGVAIAAGFLVSNWLGAVIFVAVFLHKLPEGFTVASLFLASGHSRRRALLAAALLGAATLFGVLLTNVLRSQLTYALPLAAGVTLYVAASDLIPEVNRERGPGMAGMVLLGAAVLFLLHHFAHI
ncbi:MAG: ZIP family metal transporter [Candidatus Acidiferrales bacterium]